MNIKTMIMWAVGLVIGTILFGGLLYPIVTDAAADSDTIHNVGYFEMEKYTSEESLTFTWNYADPETYNVNGEAVKFANNNGSDLSIMLGNKFAVRVGDGNLTCLFYGAGTYVSANATNPTLTITYTQGTLTATNGTATKSIQESEIYCIANDGAYVMKKATSTAYLQKSSEIFAAGLTFFGSQVLFATITGPISAPTLTTPGYTSSNFVINEVEDTAHVDTVKLTSFEFDAADSSTTKHVTYSYFVVPESITVERTHHADSAQATMFGVIPLLFVVSIVVFAAYNIRKNKL